MIVRDLLTRLGLQVDDNGFQKADRSIDGIQKAIRTLATSFVAVLGAQGFGRLISLASDASETLNVMRETFQDNADDVQAWAARVSGEVGRSEFRLREMAATLGAVLNPQMDGNSRAAAEMSTRLAQVAVDLGSFFNATDDEALIALRSGITGETEPLKRFGIVLTQANLEQEALNQGIRKSFTSLTIAEKTQLRYNAILRLSANAQGDAARTADGFANASKAVKDGVLDVATRIGLAALPAVERLTVRTRDMIRGFQEIVQNGKLAEGILFALGVAATVLGIKMLIAFAPQVALVIAITAGLAALAVIVDEILVLFSGGQTVVGDFIDSVFGLGAADEFVQNFRAGIQDLGDDWRNAEGDVIAFLGSLVGGVTDIEFVQDSMSNLGQTTFEVFQTMEAVALRAIAAIIDRFLDMADLIGAPVESGRAISNALREQADAVQAGTRRTRGRGINAQVVTGLQGRAEAAQARLEARRAQIEARRAAREAGVEVEGLTFERTQRARGRGISADVEQRRFGVARTAGVAASSNVQQDNRVELVIQGEGRSTQEIMAEVRQVVRERDERNRRKAQAALRQTATGG